MGTNDFSFIKILKGLSSTEHLIMICFLMLLIFLFLVIAIKAGINIKKNRDGLSVQFNEKNSSSTGIPKTPHHDCPHNKDVVIAINEMYRLLDDMVDLKYTDIERLKEQMSIAEQASGQIFQIATKIYLRKLYEKTGTRDLIQSPSFSSYRHVLKYLNCEIAGRLRMYMKENKFAKKTEREFSEYLEMRTETIIRFTTEFLNEEYWYKQDLSREDVYDFNQEIVPEIKKIICETFRSARDIALEYKKRNEAIKTQIEAEKNRLIGIFVEESNT